MKWFGSINNRIEENSKSKEPQVGMYCTEYCYTDRHAYEIIDVKDNRHITVRQLDAKRTDNNGMSECQDYSFSSNPDNKTRNLFYAINKNTGRGRWVERIGRQYGCNTFVLGYADEYYDYSF